MKPLDLVESLGGEPNLAYLQGVPGHDGHLHTLIGWAPLCTLEIRSDGTARVTPPGTTPATGDPLEALDAFLASMPRPTASVPFPLRDAAIGYLGYDLRTNIEHVPAAARDDLGLPLAVVGWYDPMLVHDDSVGRYYLASSRGTRAIADGRNHIFRRLRHLAAVGRRQPRSVEPCVDSRLRSNMSRGYYCDVVRRIREYIAAGDVYQVNIAQRFSAEIAADPLGLFARLTRRHPMPVSAYLDAGRFQILSNSPELFLERRDHRITTKPIKGTRRRGRTPGEDEALRAELYADPKDRAEHIMIVDLERNDLGRICSPGTVRVRDCARLYTYPTLHHLVSTVEGKVEPDLSTAAILRATFPGGSITGAPKIRAMEIIDELEPHARGVYTGALGLIDARGDMHLSLLIRTAITMNRSIYYAAGGGIVIDSTAEAEYSESLLKAQGIIEALGLLREGPCAKNSSSS